MTTVKIISDPVEYFDLLSSDQINVTDANFINDELIEVHFENVDEFVEADGKTNVVIAAFTTGHARLRLYGVLEQLNRRVLYRFCNICFKRRQMGAADGILSW
jgi:hypothetical protein